MSDLTPAPDWRAYAQSLPEAPPRLLKKYLPVLLLVGLGIFVIFGLIGLGGYGLGICWMVWLRR